MAPLQSDLLELGEGIEVLTLKTATQLQTVDSNLLGEPSTILFKPLLDAQFPTDPKTKNLVFFRPDGETRADSPVRGDVLTAEDLLKLTARIPLTNLLTTPENQVGTIGSNLSGINAPSEGKVVETTTGPETITADAQPTFSRNTLVFGLVILLIAGFIFFRGQP